MSEKMSIGSIGFSSNSISKGSFLFKKDEEKKGEQTAYMGPNIGNLLNGSATQPTASAVRA